jgi:hypothetical protein
MNKLFSLSIIPLATTATVASAMLASAPVQAFALNGLLDGAGASKLDLGVGNVAGGNDDKFTINSAFLFGGTGSFASWVFPTVTVTNLPIVLTLADAFTNSLGTTGVGDVLQAYKGTGSGSVTFNNGFMLALDTPFDAILRKSGFGEAVFTGYFTHGTDISPASGSLSTQGLGGSYSFTVQAVPEPLTIIGSGIALGFGGFLKRKQKAAQNKS